MRRVGYALLLVAVFAVSASGAPREEPRVRDWAKGNSVVKAAVRVIRALGDGLTIPSGPTRPNGDGLTIPTRP